MTHPAEPPDQVPARYYVELPRLLQHQGVEAAAVLAAAGLGPARLADPDGQLQLAEVEQLVRAIAAAGGRSDTALELGRTIRLRNHAVVGFAILSSPNVGYALRLTARFFSLIFPAFRLRLRPAGAWVELAYTPAMAWSAEGLAFHLELIAAATCVDLEELVRGPLPAFELDLSLPAPLHEQRYRQLMPQARVRFGMLTRPGLLFRLPAALAASEPALADAASLQRAEQRCRQLLEQIVAGGQTGSWVRMMLRESSDGLPAIEELAATLNISVRTLHRHLRREGLVYRALCVAERERRARQLLRETRLSVSRIAQELGYTDASNFARAFRVATGRSPKQFRAGQKPGSGL